MNEITEAITYFEDAVRDSDEIIESCEADVQAELIEQKQHFITALTALREQAEREKGCEQLQESQRWIPVSERLPEKDDDDVLLWDGEAYHVGYYRPDAKAWDNCCYGWVRKCDNDTESALIAHWMPLPEPPEKGVRA